MRDILQQYRDLRQGVDQQAERLATLHASHLNCKRRCADCCINLTVWPVEFFAILEALRAAAIRPVFDPQAACGFLKDGLCQIYLFRPIICRTHGLPLVYLDDEQDEPAYGVMFCQKNFQDAVAFGPDNTLNMDAINDTLARLQTAFIAPEHPAPDLHGRIALARLVDVL